MAGEQWRVTGNPGERIPGEGASVQGENRDRADKEKGRTQSRGGTLSSWRVVPSDEGSRGHGDPTPISGVLKPPPPQSLVCSLPALLSDSQSTNTDSCHYCLKHSPGESSQLGASGGPLRVGAAACLGGPPDVGPVGVTKASPKA